MKQVLVNVQMWLAVHKLVLFALAIPALLFLFYSYVKDNATETQAVQIIDNTCFIENKPCLISLPHISDLSIHLSQIPVPAMEQITLTVSGIPKDQLSLKIWFEGKDMDMGKHYLLPLPNKGNKGMDAVTEFTGMIPVCSLDNNMVWLLIVELSNQDLLFRVRFPLSE